MWAGSSEGAFDFQQVTIIGTGLIGGSIGLAFKENNLVGRVTCFDQNRQAALEAVKKGAADHQADTIEQAVSEADLVVLAVPVLSTTLLLREILPLVKKNTLLTDVGSTKGSIMGAVEQILPPQVYFIGGHPMAGSEESGIKGADPALLENAIYVLTPGPKTPQEQLIKLTALIEKTGAQPLVLEPLHHDRIVALASHLPHIAAATIVHSAASAKKSDLDLIRTLAAAGFRDTTRISLGNPKVWRDICLSNRWALLAALKSFKASLKTLEDYLNGPDAGGIEQYLTAACDFRKTVPHRGRGILPALFELIVMVRDTPGVLGTLTGLLGNAGINIDAIEILHVRELSGGSLRLGFRTQEQLFQAARLLQKNRYNFQIKET